MGIIQLPTPLVGQVGLLPATKKMVTTDNLATITTAGYLNAVNLESFPIAASDVIECLYNFNTQTNTGTISVFQPVISGGVITLVEIVPPGGVTVNGTPTAGHFATFLSTSVIQDGGVLGTAASKAASDNTKANVASVSGNPVPIGNLASFADVNGTVQNSGVATSAVQLKANIIAEQFPYAGGGTTVNIGNASFASTSIPMVQFISQTNPSVIETVTPSTSNVAVTLSADPGASVFSVIVLVAPQ